MFEDQAEDKGEFVGTCLCLSVGLARSLLLSFGFLIPATLRVTSQVRRQVLGLRRSQRRMGLGLRRRV